MGDVFGWIHSLLERERNFKSRSPIVPADKEAEGPSCAWLVCGSEGDRGEAVSRHDSGTHVGRDFLPGAQGARGPVDPGDRASSGSASLQPDEGLRRGPGRHLARSSPCRPISLHTSLGSPDVPEEPRASLGPQTSWRASGEGGSGQPAAEVAPGSCHGPGHPRGFLRLAPLALGVQLCRVHLATPRARRISSSAPWTHSCNPGWGAWVCVQHGQAKGCTRARF